jgi:hypothetical protein
MLDMFSFPWVRRFCAIERNRRVGGVHAVLTFRARISGERRSLRIQVELLTGFD